MAATRLVPVPRLNVRAFNKRILNPLMLILAGRHYWYAARLEHVGRRSGRSYATPVTATPVRGGFVIPLPYGPDVDWLRNLRAADIGVLVVHGRRYRISAPRVRTTQEALANLPRGDQVRARLARIDEWLSVSAQPLT